MFFFFFNSKNRREQTLGWEVNIQENALIFKGGASTCGNIVFTFKNNQVQQFKEKDFTKFILGKFEEELLPVCSKEGMIYWSFQTRRALKLHFCLESDEAGIHCVCYWNWLERPSLAHAEQLPLFFKRVGETRPAVLPE